MISAALLLILPRGVFPSDLEADLPTVKKIEILGNRSFDDGVLKKRMRTKAPRFYHIFRKPKFRNDFLRRDIESIKSFYRRNGFFDVEAWIEFVNEDERENSVHVRIMVNEGPQTLIRKLEFSGQDIISEKDLLEDLKMVEGNHYNPNLIDVDQYSLFSKFFEKGYLRAEIKYDVSIDSTEVDLAWTITPGEPVRIADIELGGNERVAEDLIRRELVITRGEYFRLKKILESKQNLYDTGYFNSVEIEPADFNSEDGSVDLALQVRERKMGYIEAGIGVGNVRGNRVFLEWGQRNLLGRGYALNLRSEYAFRLFPENEYKLSKLEFWERYQRHGGMLRFPHVFSTWNTFAVGAFYTRDATVEPAVVKTTSANASISRRFTRRTSMLLIYGLEHVQRENVEDEREKSRRRSLDLTYTRDGRDFYFNPQQGRYLNAKGRYAGGFLGGQDHYYSLIGSYQAYRKIGKQTVFAYRLRSGYAQSFGDSREMGVPLESRFFTGGGNSVRGYKENSLGPIEDDGLPIGGRVLLLTNVELRFPLPYFAKYNFGGALFIDGGNVWSSVEEIKPRYFNPFIASGEMSSLHYRYSIGCGIRYNTPVGPIRIDIGLPLSKTEDIGHDYLLHVSLGQIF